MTRPPVRVLLATGAAFLGGFAADALLSPAVHPRPVHAADTLPPAPDAAPVEAGLDRFDTVVAKVGPAVVTVDAVRTGLPMGPKGKPTEESGSGVLVKLPGRSGTFAFTNNHVVGGAPASEVTVTLADGRVFRPDQVWTDPASDIAVLRLTAPDLPTLAFGDSDRAKVGQWVLAFGSPFGLQQTVTHGIVSARNRGQISLGDTIRIKEFIQTDAPINPGNSGGPLVNLASEVVGINTAIATNNGANSGISFAIPANLARRIAKELLDNDGVVPRGYLGLQLAQTLEPATALKLGLTRAWGALVENVHPDGPAARSGLAAGDVIIKLDAVDIRDENHLINLVSSLPAQQAVTLTVWRARKAQPVAVTIGDWNRAVAARR